MKIITTFIYKGQSFTICKTEKGDLINHTMNPVKLIGLIVAIPNTNINPDGTMKKRLTLREMYNDLNPAHNTIAYIMKAIEHHIDTTEFIKENNININTPDGARQLYEYLSSQQFATRGARLVEEGYIDE